MRLRIRHVTTYEYDSPVAASTQLVRMTPRGDLGQRVIDWHVRLEFLEPAIRDHRHSLRVGLAAHPIATDPSWAPRRSDNRDASSLLRTTTSGDRYSVVRPPGNHDGGSEGSDVPSPPPQFSSVPNLASGDDGYGNRTHLISLVVPHVATRLVAHGVVETSGTVGTSHEDRPSLPSSYWLRPTRHTGNGEAVVRFVHEFGTRLRSAWQDTDVPQVTGCLEDLMQRVRERVDFRLGATDVLTTADEALRRGAGVCQDHAHVMIAVMRSLGVPARYVSGYLWPGHHVAAQASHAWVDVFVPTIGWVGFDPANACRPTEAYVRVAVGLDYFDVPPTRGVRRGGPNHESLGVTVEIDPVDRGDGSIPHVVCDEPSSTSSGAAQPMAASV